MELVDEKREFRQHKMHRRGFGGVFGACVLIGLGVGFIIDEVGQGVLIGVGLGFIALGVTFFFRRDES